MTDEEVEEIENSDYYDFDFNDKLYTVTYIWHFVERNHEGDYIETEKETVGEGKTIEEAFDNAKFNYGIPFVQTNVSYSGKTVNSKEELFELDAKEKMYISSEEFDEVLISKKDEIINKLKKHGKKLSDL